MHIVSESAMDTVEASGGDAPAAKEKRGGTSIKARENEDRLTTGYDIIKLPRTVHESGPGRWTNQLQFIKDKVLDTLMRHKAGKMFKEPINPVKMTIPNYYNFIDRPMDLSTIRTRLKNRYYQNGAEECIQDFQLMFCNCYVYNKPGTFVVQEANDLECLLLRKLMEMPEPEEDYNPGRGGSSSKSEKRSNSEETKSCGRNPDNRLPSKQPPSKKAKVSTPRHVSDVVTPPTRSSTCTHTTYSSKTVDHKSKGRGRPTGSTKKAKVVTTTTKASETPSTSTTPASTTTVAAAGVVGLRPLTEQQIAGLNIQISKLDDGALLEMLEMASPYDQGGWSENDSFLDLGKLPPVCQWKIKTFVEAKLGNEVGEISKHVKVLTADPPQHPKKKQREKKEANTITFHAVSPSPSPPRDVPSSSSPTGKKLMPMPQRTPESVSNDGYNNGDLNPEEELLTDVTTVVSDKTEEKAATPTPPPANNQNTKKTLTEVTEELLDYGEDDDEELLDLY